MRKLWLARVDSVKLCDLSSEPCMAFSAEAGYKAAERVNAAVRGDGMVLVRPADAADCPECASRLYASPIRARA